MNHDEAMAAVRTMGRARAAWGYPHDLSWTRATGQVIGYSDKPMVLIRTDDGEHLWWAAELVEGDPIDPSATEALGGAQGRDGGTA